MHLRQKTYFERMVLKISLCVICACVPHDLVNFIATDLRLVSYNMIPHGTDGVPPNDPFSVSLQLSTKYLLGLRTFRI